jgi:hypothetical protein
MSQNLNKESRAKAARLSSRFLCPRPPLRSFTKEMGLLKYEARKPFGAVGVTEGLQPISSEPAPSHRPWASVPGATPKRTSVEHGISRRTRTRIATEVSAPDAEASASTSLPRGASPRRILVSLGSPLTAVAEPTPPQRSWMSPLGVRPLADRFQTTTRRKSRSRSVTFLRDPTIPISVTWLNDLTGPKSCLTAKVLSHLSHLCRAAQARSTQISGIACRPGC